MLVIGSSCFLVSFCCSHLDHVGALPYFTEVCGYSGPIYMTYPTKALAPLMLEDYRRVMVERRGEEEQFTSEHIAACMKKGAQFSYFCINPSDAIPASILICL